LSAQVGVDRLRVSLEQTTPDPDRSAVTLLIKPAEEAADQPVAGIGVATDRVETQISVATR
jgi:hypothetical protein